jgi:glycosyltransferase involved in cell wall biosynthesis
MTKPSSPPRIFFFSTMSRPFIDEDERILARHFTVDRLLSSGIGAVPGIVRGVWKADVVLVWFGSVYAALIVSLSKLFRRGSIVVVGGVDASKEPEIGYGIWLNPLKAPLVGYAFRNAGRVLPVGPALAESVRRLAAYDGANVRWVPTGYDGATWHPGPRPTSMVTTVASCWNLSRFKAKGLDRLLDAARAVPDVPFRIIGVTEELMKEIRPGVPGNVEVLPPVPRSEILPYLQQSRVYCQPSYSEGFPNALCEAMLCGCIPVGTDVGGIPTAIGETGFLVPYGDVTALVAAIRKALESTDEARQRARERVLQEFPVSRREKELVAAVRELLGAPGGSGS